MGALLAAGAYADTLTPEEALQRAVAADGARRLAPANTQPRLAYTAKTQKGQPAVYVFSNGGSGAMLLSASDLAIPMLGYTDSGEFDPDNIPPQMQYWMNEYASQIEYAEENGLKPQSTNVAYAFPSDWTFIAPMVKTKWDQGRPYSNLLANTGYATGCVATAMAQIMKYHAFPAIGHGYHSYEDAYGKTYAMAFDTEPFAWDEMLDEYTGQYTDAQANAVAYLMKACGYSTNMTYGASSGTQVENAGTALCTYFDYDGSLEALQRYQYTHSEWATILYNQLKTVGPVLYSGHSLGNMAHAFVCDGYDGQGYFHINWGWSGLCNGYYSLDALIPSVQSTGGSNYGGYNFSQGMIVNIMPGKGNAFNPVGEFTLLGNMSGTNAGSVLTLTMTEANPGNLVNSSMIRIEPDFAIYMENVETGQSAINKVTATYFSGQQFNLPAFGPGSYIDPQFSVRARFDTSLPDGKYKVQLMWSNKLKNPNDWQNFVSPNGCHDYVYVTKDGNNYSIENLPMEYFSIDSAEIITPLYMRNPCQIRFTVTNPWDTELSQSIVPVLLYGDSRTLSFEGDSQLITVGPKETISVVTTYTFTAVAGGTSPTTSTPREYTLGAYDYNKLLDRYYQTGEFRESYYADLGTVTMKRPGNNSSIRARNIKIDNASEEGMVDGIGFLYGVDNFSNIQLSATVEGVNGFVAAPLSAVVYEYEPSTSETGAVVYEYNFPDLLYVEAGESMSAGVTLDLSGQDTGKIYSVIIYYVQQNARQQLGSVRFGASSGVDSVIGEGALVLTCDGHSITASSDNGLMSLAVYDLGGKTVATTACNGTTAVSIDTGSLAKGIYLVKATDAAGNEKVLKVRL